MEANKIETRVNDLGNMKKELVINIPADEVGKHREKVLGAMAVRLNIKGFRKGKVPKDIAEKYLSVAVEEQVMLDMIHESMSDALEQNGLDAKALRGMNFYLNPISDDGSLEYKIWVTLFPEVDPEKYMGIEVSVDEPRQVTDQDVDARIEELRKEALEPREKDGAVEVGDLVNITYSRYEEGQDTPVLADFSTALRIEEDKGLLIEGLKEAMIGLKKGEEFDVTGPSILGQDRKVYRIKGKVDKVSSLVVPELTDELAHKFGSDSVDTWKENVRKSLKAEAEKEQRERIEAEIRKKIVEMVSWEDDRAILQETIGDTSGNDAVYDYFFSKVEETVKPIKENLVLDAIGIKEGIEVTEDDLDSELQGIAARTGQPVPYIRAQYREQIENGTMAHDILRKKAMDMLVRYANVITTTGDAKGQQKDAPSQAPDGVDGADSPDNKADKQEGDQ